jgi:hypothetical protein
MRALLSSHLIKLKRPIFQEKIRNLKKKVLIPQIPMAMQCANFVLLQLLCKYGNLGDPLFAPI